MASKHFLIITIQTIPRDSNTAADELAKLASSVERPPPEVFYEILRAPSAALEAQRAAPEAQGAAPEPHGAERRVLLINETDWRDVIIKYLAGGEPEDTAEAKRLRHRARNYHMVSGQLYKGGVCAPFLRCVSRKEDQSLLR